MAEFMASVTCRLTAEDWDQLRNSMLVLSTGPTFIVNLHLSLFFFHLQWMLFNVVNSCLRAQRHARIWSGIISRARQQYWPDALTNAFTDTNRWHKDQATNTKVIIVGVGASVDTGSLILTVFCTAGNFFWFRIRSICTEPTLWPMLVNHAFLVGGHNRDFTLIWLPFDFHPTVLWPLDNLHYDSRPTCVWAAEIKTK